MQTQHHTVRRHTVAESSTKNGSEILNLFTVSFHILDTNGRWSHGSQRRRRYQIYNECIKAVCKFL